MLIAPKPGWKGKIFRINKESFWRDEVFRLKLLIAVIVIAVLSQLLGHIWVFQYAGIFAKDWLLGLRKPSQPQFTEIVQITADDLASNFDNFEPLSPQGLTAVIRKILEQDPEIVAVDIDTSPAVYRKVPSDLANSPKIVWARAGYAEAGDWGTSIHPLSVLGQRTDQEPRFSGLALFPSDRDWTVRRYENCIEVTGGGQQPSFVSAILQAKEKRPSSRCEPGKIAFHAFEHQYRFNPITLAELSKYGKNTFSNKIVLLGGSYSYLDQHPTPFGVMSGIEVVATALEATLQPRSSEERARWTDFAEHWGLKGVLTLLLIFTHYRLRPIAAMVVTMVILSVLVVFGMSIAFLIAGYGPDFVPFLIGIWIEQLYEGASKAEKEG